MFRAITKKNGPSATSDVKGTLTALWASAGSKGEATQAHPADPGRSAAENEPFTAPEDQLTPAPAARADLGQATAAPPTTGGDVAITAAPDPSPEPAIAAAKAPADLPEEIDLTAADLPSKVRAGWWALRQNVPALRFCPPHNRFISPGACLCRLMTTQPSDIWRTLSSA